MAKQDHSFFSGAYSTPAFTCNKEKSFTVNKKLMRSMKNYASHASGIVCLSWIHTHTRVPKQAWRWLNLQKLRQKIA